jgi:hypothetical protein
MLGHIKALIAAHMPDDSAEALAKRKLVGRLTVMQLNQSLAKRPERTPEIEELLAEVAFWWSMHYVATNIPLESEPPELPYDPKMIS